MAAAEPSLSHRIHQTALTAEKEPGKRARVNLYDVYWALRRHFQKVKYVGLTIHFSRANIERMQIPLSGREQNSLYATLKRCLVA